MHTIHVSSPETNKSPHQLLTAYNTKKEYNTSLFTHFRYKKIQHYSKMHNSFIQM